MQIKKCQFYLNIMYKVFNGSKWQFVSELDLTVGINTFMRTYRIGLHQVPRHSNLTINIPCPLMLDSADTTSSPVVTTRADTILEVVKAIGIPRHDLPPSHLRDESSCCMTIRTYPKVLEYTNWHSTRRMHQSISDS